MKNFLSLFTNNKPVLGMIHVDALPGTPRNSKSINEIIDKAIRELEIYQSKNIDGIVLENMHDTPYLNKIVGPEITASMATISYEIKKRTNLPIGLQILAAANKEALAVAKASNLNFIRAEGFVFSHVADEGIINSCAGELLRYRKQINAESVLVLTDIKKKHSSHAITSDIDIVETAKAAQFFNSDGLIITGKETGQEASLSEIKNVKNKVSLPIIVGSGITKDNISSYLEYADAFIIGSYFKLDGIWSNDLDTKRIEDLMKEVDKFRK